MSDNFRLNLSEAGKETGREVLSRVIVWQEKCNAHLLEGNPLPIDMNDLISDMFQAIYMLAKIIEQVTEGE